MHRFSTRLTILSALAVMGALILFQSLPSAIGERLPDNPAMIEVAIDVLQQEVSQGEPAVVELRLRNGGAVPATVLIPSSAQSLIEPPASLRLALMSSSDNLAIGSLRPRASLRTPVSLFAGAFWGCRVDLNNLFGPLAADTYTVLVSYEVAAEDAAGAQAPKGSPVWVGRAESRSATFTIRAPAADLEKIIKGYSEQVKNSADSETRLRALFWMKDNVLKPGMTEAAVLQLLGEPASRGTSGQSWRYSADKTGIELEFKDGNMVSVSGYES